MHSQPPHDAYGNQAYGAPPQQPYGDPTIGHSPHMTNGEERTAATLAHLSTIIAMVVSLGWLSFVGPLVVWLVYKDRSPFVRNAAAGSFNFNIWAWVITIVGWLLAFTVIGLPISFILWAVAVVMTLWCHIKGAVLAQRGELYTYPAKINLLQ